MNNTCPMCGVNIEPGVQNCPRCGFQIQQQPTKYQLNSQQPVQTQAVEQPVQQVQQPVQQQMLYDPNTGQPLQQQVAMPTMGNGMATINIVRPSSFFGVIANMVVSLDGADPRQLANGQTVTYNLTPGQHVISYKIWSRRRKEYTIIAESGKAYKMVFTPDWLWGGFKINNDLSILK